MKKVLLLSLVLFLVGCGSGNNSITYEVNPDDNLTIPKDGNVSLQPSEGVHVTVSGDGNSYIISGEGNVVIIGDDNIYGDNTETITTTDSSLHYDYWYYDGSSGCCYTCGECDANVTEPVGGVGIMNVDECNGSELYSGLPAWCYEVSGS